MRRRNIVALIIFIPFLIGVAIYMLFPKSWEFILGYMFATSLAFKGAILTLYTASKLKFISFVKGLTLLQGVTLLIKRWFLDNIFSHWLRRNIIKPISIAIKEAKEYYFRLGFRKKLRNTLLVLISSFISIWILYNSGYLTNLFLFTELKVIIIGISKTILLIFGKFFGIIFNSWITPIIEVFAFSWFFTWLEKTLGASHPINRFLNWIAYRFARIFAWIILITQHTIEPLLNRHIRQKSLELAQRARAYIQDQKIANELEQFDLLEQKLLQSHIDAYYSFKGMKDIKDKRLLYSLINKKTKDGIDIVAFVSRDSKGQLLPEKVDDSFYNDTFLLEGLASSQKYGVKKELEKEPDFSDFWILNTSCYPATLKSHSGIVPSTNILAQSLQHISCNTLPNYKNGDIYLEYNGRTESFIPIE